MVKKDPVDPSASKVKPHRPEEVFNTKRWFAGPDGSPGGSLGTPSSRSSGSGGGGGGGSGGAGGTGTNPPAGNSSD